ncbi:hypothetical protein OEA41_007954 [Lepraria neglecta]|uniref:Aminotransferase class V domain-containing protein n=1 Tax=Lepraria neglecta TaxID=209136 RepID=A0AAD9ZE12_9LECA|nr:hypothetical protein OEA41_007954 [Lepraria neglecta]
MGDAGPDTSLCPFGRPMRDAHFLFAPTYTPLNHGSFGTYPKPVQNRFREVQALSEARPDTFVRYEYPKMLDESRSAMAEFLGVPVDEVVFVPNATTAINVVLRSLRYEKGDVVLHLSTVYAAIEKTIQYLIETTDVDNVNLAVNYPIDDHVLVLRFETAINAAKLGGKKVKIAIFDTISSMPGVRVPWERLVEVCKREGVLSMVDGAHGAGHIELGLATARPDFFTSNCHNEKSSFEMLFEFVATIDVSPYLCIEEALKFRREVCGGEENIMAYCESISNEAGRRIAEILGTDVMENSEKTLTRCAMTNVRLPLTIGNGPCEIPEKDTIPVAIWMTEILANKHDIYLPAIIHAGAFWTRLSGQIYLEMGDFVKGAEILKTLCMRAKNGEYLEGGKSNDSL